MKDSTDATGHVALLPAVLQGGPSDLPADLRVREVTAEEQKIRIPWYGGYEHFEREHDARHPIVFRWSYRTRIAE